MSQCKKLRFVLLFSIDYNVSEQLNAIYIGSDLIAVIDYRTLNLAARGFEALAFASHISSVYSGREIALN